MKSHEQREREMWDTFSQAEKKKFNEYRALKIESLLNRVKVKQPTGEVK
jgi:hypothetical protein